MTASHRKSNLRPDKRRRNNNAEYQDCKLDSWAVSRHQLRSMRHFWIDRAGELAYGVFVGDGAAGIQVAHDKRLLSGTP